MARLHEPFDSANAPPADDFSVIPAGTYVVEVIESEERATENGRMLKLTHKVVEGEYEGRRLWNNLNYIHKSADAQRIAQQQLGALCNAVGLKGEMDDTEELHGVPVLAKVKITKSEKYGEGNGISGYAPYNREGKFEVKKAERSAPANDRAAEKPAAASSGGGKSLPWKK